MPILNKRNYRTATGEIKLNCYSIIIPKEEVIKAGIKDNEELIVVADKDKLIIKRKRS